MISIGRHSTFRLCTYVWRQDNRRRRLVQVADMEWLALHADIGRNQRVQPLSGLRNLLWLRCCSLSTHAHLRELLGYALYTRSSRLLRVAGLRSLIAHRLAVSGLTVCRRLLSSCWIDVTWLSVCWLLGHTVGGLLLGRVSECALRGRGAWCYRRSLACICTGSKIEGLTGVCSLLLTTRCWRRSGSLLLICAILFLLAVLLAVLVRVGHDWRFSLPTRCGRCS